MKKIIFVYVLLFLLGASLSFADNTPAYPPPTPYIYHIHGYDVYIEETPATLIFQVHRGDAGYEAYTLSSVRDSDVHENDGTYSKEFVINFDQPTRDQTWPPGKPAPVPYGQTAIAAPAETAKTTAPQNDVSFGKTYGKGSGLKRAYMTIKVGNWVTTIRQLIWISPDVVSLPQPRPAAVPQ